jgi:hypothetical protein
LDRADRADRRRAGVVAVDRDRRVDGSFWTGATTITSPSDRRLASPADLPDVADDGRAAEQLPAFQDLDEPLAGGTVTG